MEGLLTAAGHTFQRGVDVNVAFCCNNTFIRDLNDEHVRKLRTQLEKNPNDELLHRTPIVAFELEGMFYFIDGNHRLKALQECRTIDKVSIDFLLNEEPLSSTIYFIVNVAEKQASAFKLRATAGERVSVNNFL